MHPAEYHLTYSFTLWSSVLLEQLTGSHLSGNFLHFIETQCFITAFTRARHLSLSWARSVQSVWPPSHFLEIHPNIILPSMPGYCKWPLSFRFPHKNPVCTSRAQKHVTCPVQLMLLDFITRIMFDEEYTSCGSLPLFSSRPFIFAQTLQYLSYIT
jgi:hypothetical protein